MSNPFVQFIAGDSGNWKITQINSIAGESMAMASHLKVLKDAGAGESSIWTLKGFASNIRYTEKEEKSQLLAIQSDLGRVEATCAALIPIRKSELWWALAQDERRHIFEAQSKHIHTGLKYLPAIARKLYHCRDLGEPFDFLTWFEYAPKDADFFDELVHSLRQTDEWKYVDREVDIRLVKA